MATTRTIDRVAATVTTTDGTTVTTLVAITLPTGTAGIPNLLISAKTSTPAVGGWILAGTFKNVGGTVTQVGATLVSLTVQDVALATAAVVFDVTGATFRVRVTGVAATTIDWLVTGHIHQN